MLHFFIYVCLAILVVACPLMCLVILMQRSKQEGLGAAFGGGFTDSVWGAQTSNVLVKATVFLAATFFIVCIVLARLYAIDAHVGGKDKVSSPLQQQLLPSAVPMTATNASGTPVVPTATPMVPAAANPPATKPASSTSAAPAALSTPAAPSTNAAPKAK